MTIRDEVIQAAEALGDVLEIAFNPELDTWEKMAPGVAAAIRAINECQDVGALAPADRTRAIIDVLLTTIYQQKGMIITYSDEQPT